MKVLGSYIQFSILKNTLELPRRLRILHFRLLRSLLSLGVLLVFAQQLVF